MLRSSQLQADGSSLRSVVPSHGRRTGFTYSQVRYGLPVVRLSNICPIVASQELMDLDEESDLADPMVKLPAPDDAEIVDVLKHFAIKVVLDFPKYVLENHIEFVF